jgi:hypothetical protein
MTKNFWEEASPGQRECVEDVHQSSCFSLRIGFEKTERSMPAVIRKEYFLDPTSERLNPIAPFVEDNCMVVEYD